MGIILGMRAIWGLHRAFRAWGLGLGLIRGNIGVTWGLHASNIGVRQGSWRRMKKVRGLGAGVQSSKPA